MPAVIVAVAAAAAGAGAAAAIGLAAGTLSYAIVSAAVGGIISFAASSMMSRGKKSGPEPLAYRAQDNKQMVRQAITAHRIVYGRDKVSGPITFLHSTDSGDTAHLVVTLTCHPVDGFEEVWFNDEQVTWDAVTHEAQGTYAGKAWVWLGDGTEAGDADLVAALVDNTDGLWTARHKQTGCAKIYVKLAYDRSTYPTGVPTVRVTLRGKKVADFRTGVTAWSENPAVIISDYLRSQYGLSCGADEIDGTTFVAAANICDEDVSVQSTSMVTADATADTLTLATAMPGARTGDTVRLSSTGTPPGGLSVNTRYWLIVEDDTTVQLASSADNAAAGTAIDITSAGTGTHTLTRAAEDTFTVDASSDVVTLSAAVPGLRQGNVVRVVSTSALPTGLAANTDYYWHRITATTGKLCANYADSVAGTSVDISGGGTGTHTLLRRSERRYTMNGTIKTEDAPESVIPEMLTALGGKLVCPADTFRLYAAAWSVAADELDDDILDGSVKVATRITGRSLFNGVRGIYVDPDNSWQPSDYPAIASDAYKAEDNNERIWRPDFDLPYTNSATTAQRLAKIEMERNRRQMTTAWPCKLAALKVQVGEVYGLTRDRWGWSAKTFECLGWTLAQRDGDVPRLGVDLVFREIDANVFAWTPGDTVARQPAARTDLPNGQSVAAPASVTVTDLPFTDAASVAVDVGLSAGPFVASYQVEYLPPNAATWVVLPAQESRAFVARNLEPGAHSFRAKAMNTLGASSAYVTTAHTVPNPAVVPRVSGLELVVDGAAAVGGGTVFTGPDAHFQWRESSVTRPGSLDDDGTRDLYFQDYEVRVLTLAGDELRRVHTLDPRFSYTHDQNALDTDATGTAGPRRAFAVEVYQRGTRAGQISAVAARIEVSNPAPALPTGVTLTGGIRQWALRITPPSDLDWDGVLVWASTTSGFTPSGTQPGSGNCVYRGSQTLIPVAADPATTTYVRFACFDRFGTDSLNVSSELSVTTAQLGQYDIETGAIKADLIDVDALSAVSADLGVVTAGAMVSPDSTFVVDLDNQRVIGTGPAGQAADDYWVLDSNGLNYYRWDGAAHLPYKALVRHESAVADSGDTVTLPGYWRSQPTITLQPYSMPLYNPTYAAQQQKIKLDYTNLTQPAAGQWAFDVVAQLELASGSGATVVNDAYTGSSNTDTSAAVTTPANCTDITAHVLLKSVVGTGTAPNYYKRKVEWRVGYRVSGSGGAYTYTSWQSKSMPTDGLYAVSDQRAVSFGSANTWEVIIEYSASNLDGTTFAYGSGGYDYDSDSVTGTTVAEQSYTFQNTAGYPAYVTNTISSTFSYSPPAGWSVYSVDYSYGYTYRTERWTGQGESEGDVTVSGEGGWSYTTDDASNTTTKSGSGTGTFTEASLSSITVTIQGRATDFCEMRAKASITSASAIVYLRKPITNSSTPDNSYTWESYDYALTSVTVLATGSVLWTATGD